MSMFYPRFAFRRVYEITPEWVRSQGLSVLLLDVDNTLTTHGSQQVPPQVPVWIARMQEAGIRLLLVSNNNRSRVEPFAKRLGLGCIASAAKPLGGGVRRACKRLGAEKSQVALVGDQVFTDVLCANWAGVTAILVEPMELEHFAFFRLKRKLEYALLRGWDKARRP